MSTAKHPNIILILTDHFRRDALGKSTPNLMALAAAGNAVYQRVLRHAAVWTIADIDHHRDVPIANGSMREPGRCDSSGASGRYVYAPPSAGGILYGNDWQAPLY